MVRVNKNDPRFLDRRLALLSEVTSTAIGSMSLQTQAERMVAQVQVGFEVDSSVARLLVGEELRLLASVGVPRHQLRPTMAAHNGIAGRMIRERQPFMLNEVVVDPLTAEKYRDDPTAFRFLSYCGAPMLIEDRVVGILGIYSQRQSNYFHAVDLEHLQVVANHIAAAIANAQLVEDLQQEVAQRKRFEADLQELNTQLEARVEHRTAALRSSELRLRESEAQYRLLADSASDMISRHDFRGRCTYVSPACERVLGFTTGELVGIDPFNLIHAQDVPVVRRSFERVLEHPEPQSVTYRSRCKLGGYAWLESTARSVVDPDTGAATEVVVVSRDVTERLHAQEQLRLVQAAIDGVREAVVVTEPDLEAPGPRIVYMNPAFTAISGYEAHEVLGLSPRVLQGPKSDRLMLRRLKETLRRGEPFRGETINYHKDGREYTVEWDINPIVDSAGRVTHWVSIQRDITDRKEAEELSRHHREELAHVTRLSTMGEMASGLAHELNQPLTAISNYAHGCLKRMSSGPTDDDMVRETLGRVARQAERAGGIIKRLRAFVAKRESVRTAFDLNELVLDVLTLCEPESRQHDVVLSTDLSPTIGPVFVDVIQIEQVVLNLLRNAIEAVSDCDAERRVVVLRTYPQGEGFVELCVEDRGPGFTDEQLDHLFAPFYTTKSGGMGMGLTISQSIVEAHHGRLWAERRLGGPGACLRMRLLSRGQARVNP